MNRSFAHLSWSTWANGSRLLICQEQFAHSRSFDLSDLSDSLTVAHLSWAIWANHIWYEWNERMSDEQMSKFPALVYSIWNTTQKLRFHIINLPKAKVEGCETTTFQIVFAYVYHLLLRRRAHPMPTESRAPKEFRKWRRRHGFQLPLHPQQVLSWIFLVVSHRRRINKEKKETVVAAVWGKEFIQFLASLVF